MRKTFTFFLAVVVCTAQHAFAQKGEVKLPPAQAHPLLLKEAAKLPKQAAAKTAVMGKASIKDAFPIVDQLKGNTTDTIYWIDSAVTRSGKTMVFNAQDFAGNTYNNGNGGFGPNDMLTSRNMNLTNAPAACYVEFNYYTGSSWESGDSLVLQAKNSAGNWVSLWRSNNTNTLNNVRFELNLGLEYTHASFQLRFVNYTSSKVTNTATYHLTSFTFAPKQTIPFNETLGEADSFPSRYNWSKMQATKRAGTSFGIDWGNVVITDAMDIDGNLYPAGQYGDTVASHPYNLTTFNISDSVYFRFFYRGVDATTNDSLIIEFRNNVNAWTRAAALGVSDTTWRTFRYMINIGRNISPNFQFRVITKTTVTANDTAKFALSGFSINQKYALPFLDDFSATEVYPDPVKWIGKATFINNHFPINPPSINVATFDGLDAYGVPYGGGKGYCDTLTSKSFDLSYLSPVTDTVFLTFQLQPQGLGDRPNNTDSFIVEFRTLAAIPGHFTTVWRTSVAGFLTDQFSEVVIPITGAYLHDDFQVRFKNKGNRSGNLSHWHLDYVRMFVGPIGPSNRITDVAIQTTPSPLLNKYTSMPYEHFKLQAATYTSDTQYFNLRNNTQSTSFAINFGREIFDPQGARIDTFGNIFPNVAPFSSETAQIKRTINLTGNFTGDTVTFKSRFYVSPGNTPDIIRSNDTLIQETHFSNYYAYDDGSAEAGYALANEPGKVAIRYPLAKGDTLYGLSIFYNRAFSDVSQKDFNLMVWKEIGNNEQVLLSLYAVPVYYNQYNSFYYYKFPEPLYVQDYVYLGWEQDEIFQLNVGFDQNYKVDYEYKANPEQFYFLPSNGVWTETELNGALMIRPIVGKWLDVPVGLTEPARQSLQVSMYPNPASDVLHISSAESNHLKIALYDMTGKLLLQQAVENNTVNLPAVADGFYFVTVTDRKTGASSAKKLLIQH